MAKQYDVLFRLLMLGDSGVGKTCMMRRFTGSEFDPTHVSTIGVDFKMKTLEVDGLKVRVQIWDTAGQERYQTITKQYYRRAQGMMFVYDITNEPSFHHIAKWASDVDEYAPDKVQRILVGNKSDDEAMRQVTKEEGSKLAESYGMDFFETSASTSSNLSESFTHLTELVLQAHKNEVDNLLGSLDDYLDKVALGEEKRREDNEEKIQRENCSNCEILNLLQHVRPGGGFRPNFTIFEKCDVNGTNTHPVFAYLKDKLPYPDDDPTSLMKDPKFLVWSPICRTDVSWNFEKFVVGPEGEPFKRYSKKFPTIDIEPDIQRLLRLTKT